LTDIIGGGFVESVGSGIVEVGELLTQLGIGEPTPQETAFAVSSISKAESDIRIYLQYDPVRRTRVEYYPQSTPQMTGRQAVWEVDSTQAYLRRLSEAATDELQLLHIPVRGTSSLEVRLDYDGRFGTRPGAFESSTIREEGLDYWMRYDGHDDGGDKISRDGIIRSFGRWPDEPGAVMVTYEAGYSDNEFRGLSPLVDATGIYNVSLEESLRRFKKSFALWLKNPKLGHVAGSVRQERLGSYSYSLFAQEANTILSSTYLTAESRERLSVFRHYGTYFV